MSKDIEKKSIQVGIVEDNDKIRTLITKYLNKQEGMECGISVDSVESFLKELKKEELPNVVLMDIDLPGMSGIDGMKLINQRHPEIEIVMLTVYHDSHKIFDSLCAGASGYLLKHTSLPEIKEAIEDLANGGAPMSPQIARKVIGHFKPEKQEQQKADKDEEKHEQLTPREQEIVVGLVDGLSYKLIADRMNISIDTVRAHIRNIYRKLHVNSKAEVISKSLKGEI